MSKTPEQEKFDQFYADCDLDNDEENEKEAWCDYGIDSECVEPSLRDIGNCFECWLYQEMCEKSGA